MLAIAGLEAGPFWQSERIMRFRSVYPGFASFKPAFQRHIDCEASAGRMDRAAPMSALKECFSLFASGGDAVRRRCAMRGWKRGFLMFVVVFTGMLIVSDAEAQLLP